MLLKIENLTFGWQNETLFEDLCLNVGPGKKIVLMGENGCGKSTLLQIIAGMIPHFSRGRILKGEVWIENRSITRSAPKTFFPIIAYIPDRNIDLFLLTGNLKEEMLTLKAILNLDTSLFEYRKREFVNFFPEFENWQQIPFRLMKEHQKKLVLLLIYLLQGAKIFLLDEIFKSFTPSLYENIVHFLKTGAQNGKSFLVVNHQPIETFVSWKLKDKTINRSE